MVLFIEVKKHQKNYRLWITNASCGGALVAHWDYPFERPGDSHAFAKLHSSRLQAE